MSPMLLMKKAIRAMLRNKRAYLSCIILMAIGVSAYTTMNSALSAMNTGKDEYYKSQNLADVYISVRSIPSSAVEALTKMKGIKKVEPRIVADANVILGENEAMPHLKLIGVNAGDHTRLNNYVNYEGDIKNYNDVLLGSDYFTGRKLKTGEAITLNIHQNNYKCNIKGYAFSPEYVYLVENTGDLYSDVLMYNICFVNAEMLKNIMGMKDSYNDIILQLEDGYQFEDVKNELNAFLEKYDLISLYGVQDLISYKMLDQEITSGMQMATTVPMAFVFMAAIVLYLMLKRIIEQDRTQIGQLRAFGYSKWTILWHYMFYGFLTGLMGAIIGLVLSYFSIPAFIGVYLEYYKLPITCSITDYSIFVIGGVMSIIGGMVGAFIGAKSVINLNPSEAMRAKAPKGVHSNFAKKLPFLKVIFHARGFMALRNMSRNKARSFVVIIGIVFSFGMMVMVGLMSQMMSSMFETHFTKVLKYDAEIVLENYVHDKNGLSDVLKLDPAKAKITAAEGILNVPFRMHNGHFQTGSNITGIKTDSFLYKLYDDNRKINLPIERSKIVLSTAVANNLKVKKGDIIYMQTPLVKDEIRVQISDVVAMNLGGGAYMNLDDLNEIIGEHELINSILVRSDHPAQLKSELLFAKNVQKVMDKKATEKLYSDFIGSYTVIINMLQIIGVLISFVIIYNTAIISLSERSREYATLRVLGLQLNEVSEIMSFEYWLLAGIGAILGVPFAQLLNNAIVQMIDVEGMIWPSTIPISSYIVGFIGLIISVWLSNKVSARRIHKLQLVEVLKERE